MLTLVRHFLFIETLAKAQHVAISHGDTIEAAREVPPALFWLSEYTDVKIFPQYLS